MTTSSRRFLFALWEGGGTLPPELGVARRLVDRGHDVHVAGDPTIAARAKAAGFGFSPWTRAPHRTTMHPDDDLMRDWEVKNPLTMLRNVRDRFIAGPAGAFAADTVDVIDEVRPDIVVADSMLLGSIIGAEARQLPVAALVPNIWMLPTPGVPAVGPGLQPAKTALGHARDRLMRAVVTRIFDRGLPALNAARRDHGLPPVASLWDQLLGVDRVLVLSSAEFDFAAPMVPANVTYIGPVLDDPQWAEPWQPPWPLDGDPVVLVAFSSTFQDQGPLLQRVVDALASLPVKAVVTLGQMLDETKVDGTGNVEIVRSAPHRDVLAHASLVVTHCGHGTTLKALAAGVPMVCIPMGRDQLDTAARVVFHGAGRRVSPRASVEKIRRAIETTLYDDGCRSSARRLATAIAHEQGSADPAGALEALAGAATRGGAGGGD